MKKTLVCSFVFASLCLGCSQSEKAEQKDSEHVKTMNVIDPELQKWVGHYKGITPCITCSAFCDGCEGTTVEIYLKSDQSFQLRRTPNSETQKAEEYQGHFAFEDSGKLKIQLQGVKERNQLIFGQDYVEVIDVKSGASYRDFPDFQLVKI
ncbi:copper resistance protein NlpE N-terminal domain-containing protein [Acinetobacter sp. GXMZU3951]